MAEFAYQELLPVGPDDTTYRLLTTDGVGTVEAAGRRFVTVDPAALTLLTQQAMFDIAHLLRPGHLAQLAAILEDPEASPKPASAPRTDPQSPRPARLRRSAATSPAS